jgi:hypothetical protein
MTPARFAELVEIYGAESRRWPEGERLAAIAFTKDHPEEAANTLETARRLDEALDGYLVSGPSAKLIRRIMESAPLIGPAARRGRLWRNGASFAAVGLAGALAGALAIALLMPLNAQRGEDAGAYASTAFSNMAQISDE